MNKKRLMAFDKQYGHISYTVNFKPQRVVIDKLLNELHEMQLNYIDEAVNNSDLKQAKEIIEYIKSK